MRVSILILFLFFALRASAAATADAPHAPSAAVSTTHSDEAENTDSPPQTTEAASAPLTTAKTKSLVTIAPIPTANWDYVRKQLKLAGLKESFIQSLAKNYEPKDLEPVIRLNVLLFLKKTDYHGVQITEQAASEVGEFVKAHRDRLKKVEQAYGVPGSVIASLLWLESRYGKNTGHFHVPSVYLDLIQSTRADIQKYLLTQTSRYTDTVSMAQRKKIIARTHEKAKFAIGELYALQKAYTWKWDLGEDFRGSFSGAFGMPQFLPSSYVHFARAVDPKSQPRLDEADDAITSVGYFLRMHGWNARVKSTHLKALRAYNNSADYGNAILTLSTMI